MFARILIIVLIIAALAGVLIYSQTRPVPDKVSGFIEAQKQIQSAEDNLATIGKYLKP